MNKKEEQKEINAPEKTGVMQKSIAFFDHALTSMKGQDLNTLVERYTDEMTLVLEGLNEDQNKLSRQTDDLSAHVTILENELRQVRSEHQKHYLELEKQMQQLAKRNEQIQKQGRLRMILRQVTWIVSILSGALVLHAILKAFGG